MAVLKCKMCGGDLTITEGMSVCECEYCGTMQTVPVVKEEGLNGLYNRANMLRIKCEFDKAESLYEKILQNDTEQAEAYWGLILCKYGIEYVEDPKTFRRIPTCHRTSFDSVIADEDYKSAIQYADPLQKNIYEAEAKEIDRLQKEILALSKNEDPYDVFICYKETDAAGQRTVDSVIANDIYYQLTQEGFKVFYAAITLEDKLGSAYEPCIFAALNSAKVMLVIGTKAEHFSAVWVKNEWSRFLKMMKQDRSKTLIPCYRDMDAYDLPEEFAHLQAQDMSKIGFINDVVRGIKKLVVKEAAPAPVAVTASATPTTPTTAQAGNNVQLMLPGDVMYEGEVFANIPHGYGKAIYSNGDCYEGQWSKGIRSGHGKMIWANGGEWVGEFRDNELWEGFGTYHYEAGHRYVGEFAGGVPHGKGELFWSFGDYYNGEWAYNEQNGQGKIVWAKGGEWIGEFRDDEIWTGFGTYHYDNSCYEGEFVDGVRQGRGKYTYSNGTFYEGEWWKGKAHGRGVRVFLDGVYDGAWVNGDRQGQGKFTWNDGGEWVGEFRDDKRWSGSGVVRAKDGYYEGPLANGVMHGQGKYVWDKGGEWIGEFKDGKRWSGEGTWRYADSYYIGPWVNGLRNGVGKQVWNAGGEWVGEFKDDKRWNGSGVVHYADGYWDGSLVNGVCEGHGKYVWNKGGEWVGEFRDDKRWEGTGIWRYTDGYYSGPWKKGMRQGLGKFVWDKGGEWNGEFKDDKRWNGNGTIYYTDGTASNVVTKRGKNR